MYLIAKSQHHWSHWFTTVNQWDCRQFATVRSRSDAFVLEAKVRSTLTWEYGEGQDGGEPSVKVLGEGPYDQQKKTEEAASEPAQDEHVREDGSEENPQNLLIVHLQKSREPWSQWICLGRWGGFLVRYFPPIWKGHFEVKEITTWLG